MTAQLMIPAAGMGLRLGCEQPKALVDLAGKPMLMRTIQRFACLDLVAGAVIIAPSGFVQVFESALKSHLSGIPFTVVEGGAERQESVSRGLDALDPATDIVVIHDAARPFVTRDSIEESIDAAREFGAATVAVPCIDTILVADEAQCLLDTPDRRTLWACQTPQTFRVSVIREAHQRSMDEGHLGTDDASLVRRMGGTVKLVMGSPLNFKVTTPCDLALAQAVVEGELA